MLKNPLFLLFAFGIHLNAAFAEENLWKAGTARVCITPLEPVWMGGYAFRDRPSDGKLTELWAKALALTDARGNKAVLVTADIIRFSRSITEAVRKELAKDGLDKARILLNGSHTHSGPEVNSDMIRYRASGAEQERVDRYRDRLIGQLVQVIREAFRNQEKCLLYTGQGVARFAVNRRTNKESEISGLHELKGPSDHAVPVIRIVAPDRRTKAIVFGYACHPTVLALYKISGDYPAYAQLELEKRYPGSQAMFFIGAAGDQNPLPRRTEPLARKYGGELAAAVTAVLEETMEPVGSSLAVSYSEPALPFAGPAPTEAGLTAIIADTVRNPNWIVNQARLLLAAIKRGDTLSMHYPYPVQVWKLGRFPLIALGGEIVVDYAIALRLALGPHCIVMGYANDVMSYVPSARVLHEGGYEGSRSPVFTTPWRADIEYLILQEVFRQTRLLEIPFARAPSQ